MAKKSNFIVRGGADFSGINKAMVKTQKQLSSFQKNTARIMKGIVVALAAVGVKRIINNATAAYDYQIEQETKLAVVMRRRMGATNEMIESIKGLAMAQQKLGVIGDEVQLAGAQQLATFLKSNDALASLIPAMNNLAAQQKGYNATGQDLVNISNMMGKVMDGQVGALRRVGISFTAAEEQVLKYGNEQERAAMLAQVIENNVGNMNEALANTPRGRWQQIKNDFGDVNEQIGKAFVSLRDMFIPAMQYLARITLVVAKSLQRTFTLMNALFGKKQVQQSDNIAKSTGGAIGSIEDLGDSYEEAAKKAKRSVAGFDEINTLSETSGGGDAGIDGLWDNALNGSMVIGDDVTISPELEKISERLKNMFEPVKTSLENLKASAQPLFDTIGNAFSCFYNKVLVPFGTWTIAEAVPAFMNLLSGALDILNPLLLAFKPLGEWLWTNFLQPLAAWTGVMFIESINGVANALSAIGNWMSRNKSVIEKTTTAVVLFMAAWKLTQLLAFAQMSGGVVAALGLITKSLITSTMAKIADKAATVALTMMYAKDFVVGIGKATAAMVANAAQTIKIKVLHGIDLVKAIGASIVSLGAQAVQWAVNTAAVIANKVAITAQTLAQGLMTAAMVTWNVACGIGTALTTAFGTAVAILTSPITLVIAAIALLVVGIIALVKNFDKVKEVALDVWEGIQNTWEIASNWFGTNVVDPIAKLFTGLWGGIAKGMNFVIRGLNKISFTFPSWVPGMGGKSWGINIPEMKLPELAKGGITNGPMAAIIGDNPGGREVVSPLDDLMDMISTAVGTAMVSASQFSNQGSQGDIVVQIDGTTLARVTNPFNTKESSRLGNTMIVAT